MRFKEPYSAYPLSLVRLALHLLSIPVRPRRRFEKRVLESFKHIRPVASSSFPFYTVLTKAQKEHLKQPDNRMGKPERTR